MSGRLIHNGALSVFFITLLSCNQLASKMGGNDHPYTNRLINETSPYLLQHAHNPVDWYPWGEEALTRAKTEDKPILVSIGYAACHWCHVMERESFEDTAVARIMNEHFICIKIDREERPDIDNIYMEAVQVITGSGGWPLNVFLTPNQEPFFGGTYFPPTRSYNRPSWTEVLENVAVSFRDKREAIDEQATRLRDHLQNNTDKLVQNNPIEGLTVEELFSREHLQFIYSQLKPRFDKKHGGFGGAPKFLNTMNLQFLLRYHYFIGEEEALEQVTLSLDKMIRGGLYDQLGGGFARYSTDSKWLVPHFEKMLYDNALMITVLSEAYQVTQKELYKKTIEETLDFIAREMTNDDGGFYSTLDADSDGEEGKFYVWQEGEIDSLLGDKATLFKAFYDVSTKGNWEHKNILNRPLGLEDFADKKKIDPKELEAQLQESREILFKARSGRIRPGLDDKILINWNALMASAYAKAYAALGHEKYREAAVGNIEYLVDIFRQSKKSWELHHTYKDGKSQHLAFLEDYAYLIEALINVYEISFEEDFLEMADEMTEYVFDNYYDPASRLFYFTAVQQKDILLRSKEIYDGATPSGNGTMAGNLHRLGIITGKKKYTQAAVAMLNNTKSLILQYAPSFGKWANALVDFAYPIHEIAVVGKKANQLARDISALFIPNKLVMATVKENDKFPLLIDKTGNGGTLIYVCRNYACKLPVSDMESFKKTIAAP